ncbi:MAG: reverse transcriptase domain-containing protein [Alphaproteobacteria bacterium]
MHQFFPIKRGVRQGCPLSPYIFIICTEVLTLCLKHNRIYNGIMINDTELLIGQYADDTVLFIDGSDQAITSIMNVLNIFDGISGLRTNFDKSYIFPIGYYVFNTPIHILNCLFKLSYGPICYLGISFTHHHDDFFRLNFLPKLSRLKSTLNLWSIRDLTPIGKILIVKTFALSNFVYLFTVLPNPPQAFIDELNTCIYNFIWKGKIDKVKRSTIIANYNEGGLRMPHINSFIHSLKCSWVRRYISDVYNNWKLFFDIHLRKFGCAFLFNCNMHITDLSCINNNFVRDICKAWSTFNFNDNVVDYKNQIVLNNHFIKIGNATLFNSILFSAGCFRLKNFFNANGSPKNFHDFINEYKLHRFPFMTFLGIIAAVPAHWKNRVLVNNTNNSNITHSELNLSLYCSHNKSNSNKLIYSSIVRPFINEPTSLSKWKIEFPNIVNWSSVFLLPFKCVSNPKLKYFQYRFIHRILAVNSFLHKIGIHDSPLCSFCNNYNETLGHLFWDCPVVNQFWFKAANDIITVPIRLSKDVVFFGYLDNLKSPFNYFILHVKHYIYCCRCNGTRPQVNQFHRLFSFNIRIKEYINKS